MIHLRNHEVVFHVRKSYQNSVKTKRPCVNSYLTCFLPGGFSRPHAMLSRRHTFGNVFCVTVQKTVNCEFDFFFSINSRQTMFVISLS